MSVNFAHLKSQLKTQLKAKLVSWRFGILLAVLLFCFGIAYFYWIDIIQMTAHLQQRYSNKISQLLQEIDNTPLKSGSILILIAFLYGVIHAVGPGHGKAIIATYVATHPQKLKKSLCLTLLGSLLQGIVAILIVSVVILILNLSRSYLQLTEHWLEKLSFVLIMMIGLTLIFKAFKQFKKISKTKQVQRMNIINSFTSFSNSDLKHFAVTKSPLSFHSNHTHSINCDCGHKHTLDEQEVDKKGFALCFIVLSIGMRPCSGALSLLMFAYLLNLYSWGVLAVLMMSIGTALTISFFAFLVHFARESALKLYSNSIKRQQFFIFLLLIGGCLLFILGLILYQSLDLIQTQAILMPKKLI